MRGSGMLVPDAAHPLQGVIDTLAFRYY